MNYFINLWARPWVFGFLGLAVACATTKVLQAETTPSPIGTGPNQLVTFNKDIAAIIHNKCSMCHRPGQFGPFPLLSYDDVKSRAETIDAVIDSGYMPPWKPVNENVKFANDRRLSSEEKGKLKAWISSGMPVGNQPPPTPPEFPDGWTLGQPDLVVTMNGQFEVPASGPDVYRSFVFPLQLPEDKWVKAVELKPNAETSMHHAIFFVDRHGNARNMDGQDGAAGIGGMGFLTALFSQQASSKSIAGKQGHDDALTRLRSFGGLSRILRPEYVSALSEGLGVYVPGTIPVRRPGDLAALLPKGSDVVMQTHFHPSGKVEIEQATLALYFADKAPSRRIVPVQVPPMFGVGQQIKIPSGESDYRVTDSFELPIDVQAISVFPHGHYVCRQASICAEFPDGTTKTLVKIDDWDLDWQDTYYFADPLALPAGTVLRSELVYDNSAANPENPNDPPREVRWGLQSGDEMGSVIVNVVAINESERPRLESALEEHFISSVLDPENIVDLLMQLDLNGDGSLQPSETPAGLDQALTLLDGNRNQALEPAELEILKVVVKAFQQTRE